MIAAKNMAEAIRNVRLINGAWDKWHNQQPADDAPQDEGDAWQIGWDTFGSAHEAASEIVREMPCNNLPEAATKARFLVNEMKECTEPWRWAALDLLAADLERLCDRPTQDAFAVKLARYYEACGRRDAYEAAHRPAQCEGLPPEWQAFESAMFPFHNAVFDAGRAVLLEPAPDMAAMLAKRDIFDALEFWSVGDEPDVFRRLFADAIALAGGAPDSFLAEGKRQNGGAQ